MNALTRSALAKQRDNLLRKPADPSLVGRFARDRDDEDGLAAVAIHKEIGTLNAGELSHPGKPLPGSADAFFYAVGSGVVGCVGYYPCEHALLDCSPMGWQQQP
jgi:hypothetical protein